MKDKSFELQFCALYTVYNPKYRRTSVHSAKAETAQFPLSAVYTAEERHGHKHEKNCSEHSV